MALTTQSANLVWQKVKNALTVANSPASNPVALRTFIDALKPWLAQQKRNIDLQFVPFTAEQAVTNNGTSLVGGACTLYGMWYRARRTTGTTNAFLAIHDAADNTATTTTVVTAKIKLTGNEGSIVSGVGYVLATDAVISSATAVGGATESSTADEADGFIIVGA
jgi:hypothetical protein